jgi:hypothetical protein
MLFIPFFHAKIQILSLGNTRRNRLIDLNIRRFRILSLGSFDPLILRMSCIIFRHLLNLDTNIRIN